MLLVVIGLYQVVTNYKIQDILVELIGTRTPQVVELMDSTGVIQSTVAGAVGSRTSVMDTMATTISRIRTVFVPSDVCLIDLLNNYYQ